MSTPQHPQLTGEDLAYMRQQDLVLRHVSSNDALDSHRNTVSGDMYSLSNFGFAVSDAKTDGGYAPAGVQKVVDDIMENDPDTLAGPVSDRVRSSVRHCFAHGSVSPQELSEKHFVVMSHQGSSTQSYSSGTSYDQTLGKHGRQSLSPDNIRSVISFDRDDIQSIQDAPAEKRRDVATDIVMDKLAADIRRQRLEGPDAQPRSAANQIDTALSKSRQLQQDLPAEGPAPGMQAQAPVSKFMSSGPRPPVQAQPAGPPPPSAPTGSAGVSSRKFIMQ